MKARHEQLDPVLHQPVRLSIAGMLRPADSVEFRFIGDELGLGDSNLSQHLTVLENAGYVEIKKGSLGRRPKTWVRLTRDGRSALTGYERTLRALLNGQPGRTK